MGLFDKNSHNTITQVLEDFGNEIQKDMEQNLSEGYGLASGDLFESINFTSKVMGSTFTFRLTMKDYWEAVDKGRKAGKAPKIGPILEWVNTKATFPGITPPGKSPISEIPNIRDKAVQRGLAYVIARKIGKKGTKGNNFYSDVVTPERLKRLEEDLGRAAAGDLQIVLTEAFDINK